MSSGRKRGHIAGVFGFTIVSRGIGFLRELIIAVGFGFSRITDAFYQLAATPTYLMTFITGPFATSYIAWVNGKDAPDERLCRALTLKFLLACAGILAACMFAVTLAMGYSNASSGISAFSLALMSMSCVMVALFCFCSTVSNAKGRFIRAQSILFANNLGFVALLGVAALLFRHSAGIALTSAFSAAALIAALYGLRALRHDSQGHAAAPIPDQATKADLMLSVRKRFLPMLAYASIETLGFLATQAVVLFLASSSGVGVASAGSLAQRIALTANGLVVNPMSNVVMVRMTKIPEGEQRAYLVKVASLTMMGLGGVALSLSLFSRFIAGLTHSSNGLLLAGLIPSYSLWLVAQGTNMMLSRLSFARGAVRIYTVITVTGYFLANGARYYVWSRWGFGPAIAVGSATELAASLIILATLALRRA